MSPRLRSLPLIAISLVFSLYEFGCKEPLTAGYSPSDLRTIVPLKAGSAWTYLDIIESSLPSFPDDSEVVHCVAGGYFDSASTRYYAMSGYIGEGDSGKYFESVTQSRYQRCREDENGKRIVVATILDAPINTGHQWFANGFDNTLGYAVIANADTTILVASGTFSGVIYVRQSAPSGTSWFIKPGIGIVYETSAAENVVTRHFMSKSF